MDLENILRTCTNDQRAKELAEQFVNTAHRTNQQSAMRFVHALIVAVAESDFDARNNMANIYATELKRVPYEGLPYI